jgi:hypothetical protein
MKTLFQTTIEHLLKSHNLLEAFQTQEHFHVRFEMPHFDRLVVERHGAMISVSHYFEQNGDLVPDPDVNCIIRPGFQQPLPSASVIVARSSLNGMVRPL